MQVYSPTNDVQSGAKDDFYDLLQSVLEAARSAVPKHDLLIVIGDWNAKVGQAEEGAETSIGKYPLSGGVRNDNGEGFVDFRGMNILLITTVFPRKD